MIRTMAEKIIHEFRDPIHVFIHADGDERLVIDSRPVQRLRQVHQLAMAYLLYPGATHSRFEHSLGVMELAGRVFDVVANPATPHPTIRDMFPRLQEDLWRGYWRRVLRMASLCHDVGHLPFSHAAEHALLPEGWSHETLTVAVIESPQMATVWNRMTPALKPRDVAKIAVGAKKFPEQFDPWEAVVSEILVGDAFGVDRMDYLLRDSLHAGVGYGRFDHYRLIETLRLLPAPGTGEPQLGIEQGGLHAAEALLLSRYFMFMQVYLHPVRQAYDIHLMDFLSGWLPGGKFSTDVDEHLRMTDIDVLAAISNPAEDLDDSAADAARRIRERDHFRVLWESNPNDLKVNPEAGRLIFEAAKAEFGEGAIREDRHSPAALPIDFPVLLRDGEIVSAQELSTVLPNIPPASVYYVLIDAARLQPARNWLRARKAALLGGPMEKQQGEVAREGGH